VAVLTLLPLIIIILIIILIIELILNPRPPTDTARYVVLLSGKQVMPWSENSSVSAPELGPTCVIHATAAGNETISFTNTPPIYVQLAVDNGVRLVDADKLIPTDPEFPVTGTYDRTLSSPYQATISGNCGGGVGGGGGGHATPQPLDCSPPALPIPPESSARLIPSDNSLVVTLQASIESANGIFTNCYFPEDDSIIPSTATLRQSALNFGSTPDMFTIIGHTSKSYSNGVTISYTLDWYATFCRVNANNEPVNGGVCTNPIP